MNHLLDQLATSVTRANSLEELTRPLLEMLEAVTGLESTYLTTIDLDAGVQHILYARNADDRMQIGEGLSVAWSDSVCKRALNSGKHASNTVPEDFGDSPAVAALGLQTYMTAPVMIGGGKDEEVYGTLCAASGHTRELDPHAERVLALFAKLIGQYVDRERLMRQLMNANEQLAAAAMTDTLTGLASRRALQDGLTRLLAQGERSDAAVLIAFVDMDGFKAVNDTHGHDTGDQFLVEVANRLRRVLRAGDLAARIGGDEFVIAGIGPNVRPDVAEATRAFQQRIFQATIGDYALNDRVRLDYAGASVGAVAVDPGSKTVAQALREADVAMYEIKQSRKARAALPSR